MNLKIEQLSKNIDKYISKNLSSKYNQKLLDCPKQSTTDTFKAASKRAIPKIREATGELISNKITDNITKVSRGFATE